MAYADRDRQRAYQKEWVRKKRIKYLSVMGSCVSCGESDIDKLQVHYRDKGSKVSHRIWSWSDVRIKDEISKCNVMCASCHKGLHDDEKVTPGEHGTWQMYKRRRNPCRCDDCRKANAVYETNRRAGSSEVRVTR